MNSRSDSFPRRLSTEDYGSADEREAAVHPPSPPNVDAPLPTTTTGEERLSTADTLSVRSRSPKDWAPDAEGTPAILATPGTSMPEAAAAPEALPPAVRMGVEGIRLGGQKLAVETVWTVELRRVRDDFSVDVELASGITLVVPHTRKHVDGRWFVIAKDAPNRRQLVARFQQTPLSVPQQMWRVAGSPMVGDLSSLIVLVLAALIVLDVGDPADGLGVGPTAPPGTATSLLRRGGSRGAAALYPLSYPLAVLEAIVQLLAALCGLSGDALAFTDLMRASLLCALLLTLCTRLLARLVERFPPTSNYTLSIQPRAGMLDDELAETAGARAASWLLKRRGPTVKLTLGDQSLTLQLAAAFKAAIVSVGAEGGVEGGSASTPNGTASTGHAGEIDLWVGPLLDAIERSLQIADVFGTVMMLAVKNDEGNLRKARKAWESYAVEGSAKRVATLRGLLEAEKASNIHKEGAVLCDPSAAIALLWMRRTLQFLGRCLQGLIDDVNIAEVGGEAYRLELEPFHNWLLKQTFSMALTGFPARKEIFTRLGAHVQESDRDRIVPLELQQVLAQLHLVVESMRSLFEELDLEDMRKV